MSKSQFQEKIELIRITYDYKNGNKDQFLKEERLNSINKLIQILSKQELYTKLVIPNMELIFKMIGDNIFNNQINRNEKENEEYWEYKKEIYEIFYKLISNEKCESNTIKKYFTQDFIYKLVKLFDSNIDEERDKLKRILHKLYGIIVCRRKMLRNIISNYINNSFIISNKTNGAEELLDVVSSIVSGFLIPLREENINFFTKIIIPLHKVKNYGKFHESLIRCVILFLSKDRALSYLLIEGILECFSSHNFNSKIYLLEELEEILDFCDIKTIRPLVEKLLNTKIECLSEFNNNLREKALSFFDKETFISIIQEYINISYNIIVPKIYYLEKNSWDEKIKLSYNVINESLKKYDLERYNNALKIKINNEIKILPENEEEEERQIKLAIELSQKEGEKEYKKENENIYEKGLYHFGDNKIDENQNIKNIKKSVLYDYFGQISINEIEEEQYDEEFGICPITQEYMKHPVLCPSGNYYEKSAILDWLKKNDTEPLTRQHLTANMLVEDEEYRKKIIEYRKKFNK